MTFYPTVFDKSVYLVGISPFANGHQLYVAGYGIGILNIAIVGKQEKIPQISFAFIDSFGINHDFITAINEFIAGHYEELITSEEE
jgi:hypothetical protein